MPSDSPLPTALSNPYGWHPVPRSPSHLLQTRGQLTSPTPYSPTSNPLPSTPLVTQTLARMRTDLPLPTLNHCLRVYHFGLAILQTQFPAWLSSGWISAEAWALVVLYHDIGTPDHNLHGTALSFDFWGGIEALRALGEMGAPRGLAESVAEAVIRHQDPGESGMISCAGALVQMATLLDNAGRFSELVHEETVREVVGEFPRLGWTGCFAGTIREEIKVKRWAHSTAIEGFVEMVEGNELMRPFEES